MRSRSSLSELEARIIEFIAAGEGTISIATKLYLSRQGVEYHVSKLLQHLRVPNRPALIAKAYCMGLLAADTWPPEARTQEFDRGTARSWTSDRQPGRAGPAAMRRS
ncbi:MAG: LuxR C-terminal-related transcriptional regulator [Actinophytocola sp.]|uniref:LuxR C-terminal-related transcriptional regulator n=1 Tax=Actinophytocola sp. TaxID=1872138 RepID=UPI003C777F62